MGLIYMIKNSVNPKRYIGQSWKKHPMERILDHLRGRTGGNQLIAEDIEKYGSEVFSWKIIQYDIPKSELDSMERLYIATYNTVAPNGYNLTSGGGRNKINSEITREKCRQIHLGKPKSKEHIEKLRGPRPRAQGKNHHHFGREYTQQEIDNQWTSGTKIDGCKFRFWRISKEMTILDFSKSIGITASSIRKWEQESLGISDESRVKILNVFGFDITEKFKLDPNNNDISEPVLDGSKMRKWRKDQGLTAKELGKMLDLSFGPIYSWEHNRSIMSDSSRVAFVRVFGFDPIIKFAHDENNRPLYKSNIDGDKLKRWRKSQCLTRLQLKNRLECSHDLIRNWERERSSISNQYRYKFKQVFGFDPVVKFKKE